ncbi:MAG: M48 family metallopeptidase [Tannerella sp.]|nr:M48 family metallopeptidase [Tannerella sp.]
MKYVGIQTQKHRNNIRSMLMLCFFPCIILALAWVFFFVFDSWEAGEAYASADFETTSVSRATEAFVRSAPWILGICLVWFLIAYCANTAIINAATGSRPLERRENKRVYNLVENLCIASHMDMPKIHIVEDNSLNAFASGINRRNFTVTLSRGIINRLNDAELEAVIAHELTHIRNHDVKTLIVSIVFVGIFSFLTQILLRVLFSGRIRTRNNGKNSGGIIVVMLLILLLAAIGYFITLLMRFAISRNREYIADAGSAEMTKNPLALASALHKISEDPCIEAVTQNDVAQLFIDNPMKKSAISSLFATHPPIEKRIRLLEQF